MMSTASFQGAFTALVTPFSEDTLTVDFDALAAHVDKQLAENIDGLVACGTTGESPTLSDNERTRIVQLVSSKTKGRVPVIAGVGTNATDKSIRAAASAVEAGADGVMIVMPYYNKPSQEGLFQHIVAVARSLHNVPVLLYNIPGRTNVDLSVDTLARVIDASPNVVAIKDATGNILRCQQMVARFGSALTVMSGDDALTLGMMISGARGVVSVTSNLLPASVSAVCRSALDGKWEEARNAHMRLLPVHEAMFIEPNPGPVKAALAAQGRLHPALRLPLVFPSASTCDRIANVLRTHQGTPQ